MKNKRRGGKGEGEGARGREEGGVQNKGTEKSYHDRWLVPF